MGYILLLPKVIRVEKPLRRRTLTRTFSGQKPFYAPHERPMFTGIGLLNGNYRCFLPAFWILAKGWQNFHKMLL
jgi:hypothetical protein